MAAEYSVEIDTYIDWLLAEQRVTEFDDFKKSRI